MPKAKPATKIQAISTSGKSKKTDAKTAAKTPIAPVVAKKSSRQEESKA